MVIPGAKRPVALWNIGIVLIFLFLFLPFVLPPWARLCLITLCCPAVLSWLLSLTHWGWDNLAVKLQTTISNALSSIKMIEFWSKFYWSLFLRSWQEIIIGSVNGLATSGDKPLPWTNDMLRIKPNITYLLTWTNDDLVQWPIYASPGLNNLMNTHRNFRNKVFADSMYYKKFVMTYLLSLRKIMT